MRAQTTAVLVLAAIAAFLVATVAVRMHEGRCHGGGGRYRGLDCSYAPKVDGGATRGF